MTTTNRNGIEWTVLYMHKYSGTVGRELYPFKDDMKGYLISYLENWNRKWDASGTEESSFLETGIDSIINDPPGILELEDSLKQNNDGTIHTAVVPANDNSLEQNNVNENANNFFRGTVLLF